MSFSQGHALLIGVGTYTSQSIRDVPVTVRDARAVAGILEDANYCGYPADQVSLIKEEETTKERVLKELTALSTRTGEDSTVFLFFCSHGEFGTDGGWYFTTHDTEVEFQPEPRVVPSTAIGEKELINHIKAIPAKKKFIVFNTCYSGEMGQTLSLGSTLGSKNPGQDLTHAILNTGEGNVIITASGSDQLSYFSRSEDNTIFTKALVNALKGNGVRGNGGYIGAFDLYSAVYYDVKETVADRFEEEQEPELTVLKAVGSMPIALYRGTDTDSLSVAGGYKPEAAPADARVNAVSPERAARAYTNHFGDHGTQYNIETIYGDFVGGDKIGGDKINVGGDMNVDRRTQHIDTDGGAFIGGNVDTGGGSFTGRDNYSIGNVGNNSTIAQGSGNTVVGNRGVNIGGTNSGNVITGDGNVVGSNNQVTDNRGGVSIGGNVGNIGPGAVLGSGTSNISGTVAGGDINMVQGSNPSDIAAAFAIIQDSIAKSPALDGIKTASEPILDQLKSEAEKGEGANETVVSSLVSTLITMIPDITEVVLTTFMRPVKGLGLVFQKVAKKAQGG